MALIGISGRIGSGKDTVGLIIQYLNDSTFNHLTFEQYLDEVKLERPVHSSWQIKRFAGKVKEICSILTGIPVADFEKQEVKDRVLGEEWIRYGYADGFMKVYRNGTEETVMYNKQCSKERYEQELRTNWQTAFKHEYTVREILQRVGTEAMRNVIHENVWVNALFADYKSEYRNNPFYNDKGIYDVTEEDELLHQPMTSNWIITDTRFVNEAEAIKSRGGLLIRVNRNTDGFAKHAANFFHQPFEEHPSETALDSYTGFDYIVDNDSTIESLIEKIKIILVSEHILVPLF